MSIRPVRLSDAAALAAIYAPYVRDTAITFEEEVPDEAEFRRRIRHTTAVYPYLVWEENEQVLGYAYASRVRPRAAYDWAAELSVYVARGSGGKGIGSALYRALLDLLRRQGVRQVYGVVSLPNEPSHRLHMALGFTQLAVFPKMGYKMGRWRDVGWYGLALTEEFDAAPAPLIPAKDLI